MAQEIERKFLLRNDDWRRQADAGTVYLQGYLGGVGKASVRVRLEGEQAFLNIKGAVPGVVRREYQYAIPPTDARELLETLCEQPLIEKVRYKLTYGEHLWEIDVFGGDNVGLVVAEIELQREDEAFARPDWLGKEVSHEHRYYNTQLCRHPFKSWPENT
jgi:adenylate cyclase